MSALYLPFILQGLVMLTDEFHFHRKRGLPLWERIGHPLDTLSTFLTLLLPAFFPFTIFYRDLYITLAIFSCLFITKDEFIHKDVCSKTEQWLHALLFILHPLTFMAAYLLWVRSPLFLKLQVFVILAFMFYQIYHWSLSWIHTRK